MTDPIVFTIGHSTHEAEAFIGLLNRYGINCLIDVRSAPYSRIAPQFNKETLSASLKEVGILYAHFEKEFGARPTRPSLLDEEGKVDFDKVRASAEFQQGVQRLKKALELGYNVALMCSEANPFDCHRFSMISYQLVKEGLRVQHLLADGEVIENSVLEEQLLQKYHKKLPQTNLFEIVTRETQLEVAYRLRGKDVAFSASKANSEEETGEP
jgi:uncharacterized protein (DUF488 family)